MSQRCPQCGAVLVPYTVNNQVVGTMCRCCGEHYDVEEESETSELVRLRAENEEMRNYVEHIASLPSCNTCAKNVWCIARPKPGQVAAINCALYSKERNKKN